MLGGAGFYAATKLKQRLIDIAAHDLSVDRSGVVYSAGGVRDPVSGTQRSFAQLVHIAHRNFHKLPPGFEPGLDVTHVMQVPTGGQLPTTDGRVQMYPVHSFEFHVVLLALDPLLGKPEIRRYVIGHDCGTVINPDIVRGMTLGGMRTVSGRH